MHILFICVTRFHQLGFFMLDTRRCLSFEYTLATAPVVMIGHEYFSPFNQIGSLAYTHSSYIFCSVVSTSFWTNPEKGRDVHTRPQLLSYIIIGFLFYFFLLEMLDDLLAYIFVASLMSWWWRLGDIIQKKKFGWSRRQPWIETMPIEKTPTKK
jgi:hypothetical protein